MREPQPTDDDYYSGAFDHDWNDMGVICDDCRTLKGSSKAGALQCCNPECESYCDVDRETFEEGAEQ